MNYRALFRLSRDPRFISGIHDYCDGWCERCPLTSRCFRFAADAARADEALQTAGNDKPVLLDGDQEEAWREIEEKFRLVSEMIECEAKERGMDLSTFSSTLLEERTEVLHQRALDHKLSLAAKRYADMADLWLERISSLDSAATEPLIELKPAVSSEAAELIEMAADATEVILWYQHQIWVMLVRGLNPDDEPWILEEDPIQNFANGYVKVAPLGIDRSILGWNKLLHCLPCRPAEILPHIERLDELRKMTEEQFPNARQFIRPGFDDGTAGMVQ